MDREIIDHYALGVEDPRLTSGDTSRIEFARTKELLERILPEAPARILDVGGGPGRYASWLADRGYEVHLLDPVPLHVQQAATRAGQPTLFKVALGEARHLPMEESTFDAVLLLGPLYHLVDPGDRARALFEARRVVRPDGPVVAAAISRFASLLDGLRSGALSDPDFRTIVDGDLSTGRHVNATGRPEFFTTAYFHRPNELKNELIAAGLHFEALLGVEGPGWLLWERWNDATGREHILKVARAVEAEDSLIGASSHLLAIGRK